MEFRIRSRREITDLLFAGIEVQATSACRRFAAIQDVQR
jgi:hypothetical protein